MKPSLLGSAFFVILLLTGCGPEVRVASKSFTESVILGELARVKGSSSEMPVGHLREIGGTQVLWRGLLRGDIDAYADYTGTIAEDIFSGEEFSDDQDERLKQIEQQLARRGIKMTQPLGFNNTYAIGMLEGKADDLGITKISDLRDHPDIRFGFSPEFVQRTDGWPGLRKHYGLSPVRPPEGLQHTLAYQALSTGDIDAMELYSTDAEIEEYGLRVLEDDEKFFPNYSAVFLYRENLVVDAPELVAAMESFGGKIDDRTMTNLNAKVKIDLMAEEAVAQTFIFGDAAPVSTTPRWVQRLIRSTWEHLYLVVVSLAMAICVAIPLGVLAAKRPRAEQPVLITAEIIQTIPGLALLVILMFPIGALGNLMEEVGLPRLRTIGPAPAIVALFMYSLLPIIRNTHAGITGIAPQIREAAEAIGLSAWEQLWKVELPLASRLILAGVKTTAVINVGYATLGGLIGAGGYGQLIMEGLRKLDFGIMMEGAIPSALMALAVKFAFEWSERLFVPLGLRLKGAH